MRVFVAGASGTLGRPLVQKLVARGHTVTGLTRSAPKRSVLEQLGAEPAVADALDARELRQAVETASPDCVVHALTALPKGGPLRISDLKATNELRTTGTANLLQAAIAAGAKRFVAQSLILIYGFGDHGPQPMTEADPLQEREPRPWLQESVDALRSLEGQLRKASEEGRLATIALRYGLFYGEAVPSTQFMLRMLKRRLMPTVTGIDNPISWIHLDDAVTATVAAIERGEPGRIYNIVDDQPVSMNQWMRQAAEGIGAPAPWSIPHWILRMLAPYPAMLFATRLPVDNSKARRELDWRPRFPSSVDGLQQIALEA